MQDKIKKLAENQEKLVNKILELEKKIEVLTEDNKKSVFICSELQKIIWKIKQKDI
jgi:hypothetical protein